jgi:filamentous hemagglutinin family protein
MNLRPMIPWIVGDQNAICRWCRQHWTPVFSSFFSTAFLSQVFLSQAFLSQQVNAQGTVSPIVSDGSLRTSSVVNNSVVNNFVITGGTSSGPNLFHSFDRFSVPVGQTAIFQSDSGIHNIIARVTGVSRSVIEGAIQAPGNLFFMNPNGITFGPNIELKIGGSFFATTAPSLVFADGTVLGSDRTVEPILSVNLPVGIQWGSRPSASIQNLGVLSVPETLTLIAPEVEFNQASATGKNLEIQAPIVLSLTNSQIMTVNGGDLTLQVRDLNAKSSLIESSVSISDESIVKLGKLSIQGKGELIFDQLTSVATRTLPGVRNQGNDIDISGRSIKIYDGSDITTQSLGDGNTGNIKLSATDRLELLDRRPGLLGTFPSIGSSTFLGENTRSGDITLTAPNILIGNKALVQVTAVQPSQITGNIQIQANESIEINSSIISNLDFSDQRAGMITLVAPNLKILNGSWIESNVFNNVKGSTIALKGSHIAISGKDTIVKTQTSGPGSGGDVVVEGREIRITDGAQIQSLSTRAGSSGNVRVTASDRILIEGNGSIDPISDFLLATINLVGSSAQYIPASQLPPGSDPNGALLLINPLYSDQPLIIPVQTAIFLNQQFTGINAGSSGSGKAGNIALQAPKIDILFLSLISNTAVGEGDSAKVSIQTQNMNLSYSTILSSSIRSKQGGTIDISADTLNLLNSADIVASTVEGDGGIVNLNLRDRLTLTKGSNITARAAQMGRGGYITINNENGFIISDSNNNDIIAAANEGRGGVITIKSAGIFNIRPSDIQTINSDIIASSQTGIQGDVTLKRTQQEVAPAAIRLSDQILDYSNSIIPSCPSIVRDNRLILTGQGGRIPSPMEMLNLLSLNLNASSANSTKPIVQAPQTEVKPIEASHWRKASDGTIVLLPNTFSISPLLSLSCAHLLPKSP